MSLHRYGVLACEVVDTRAEGDVDSPHFQVHVRAADTSFRVAVNVLSQESPSELLYVAVDDFKHPMLDQLRLLPDGCTPVASVPGGVALDFVRGNLFDRESMRPLPHTAPGPDNDLAEKLHHYAGRAMSDPRARLYALGERWGEEPEVPDKVFGFSPGNGIHDIHMNQGNSPRYRRDDGCWQDGGLLFHFPEPDRWVGVFLAFQSQSWHTDDSGHAVETLPEGTERRLRIVAALVNPVGPAPEPETVTLLNPGVADVPLEGWTVADRLGNRVRLPAATLSPGEAIRVALGEPVHLGNAGGTITLLDEKGFKVDGVSYTSDQSASEGITVVF